MIIPIKAANRLALKTPTPHRYQVTMTVTHHWSRSLAYQPLRSGRVDHSNGFAACPAISFRAETSAGSWAVRLLPSMHLISRMITPGLIGRDGPVPPPSHLRALLPGLTDRDNFPIRLVSLAPDPLRDNRVYHVEHNILKKHDYFLRKPDPPLPREPTNPRPPTHPPTPLAPTQPGPSRAAVPPTAPGCGPKAPPHSCR